MPYITMLVAKRFRLTNHKVPLLGHFVRNIGTLYIPPKGRTFPDSRRVSDICSVVLFMNDLSLYVCGEMALDPFATFNNIGAMFTNAEKIVQFIGGLASHKNKIRQMEILVGRAYREYREYIENVNI